VSLRPSLFFVVVAACGGGSNHDQPDGGPRPDGGAQQHADAAVFPDAKGATGASPQQMQAWNDVNSYRAMAGVPPLNLDDALDQAAQAHALYYMMHPGLSTAHMETSGMSGFTGVNFWDRDSAAGYTGAPMAEVMAFFDMPDEAIAEWMSSVLHRIPIIHPDAIDMGYGGATGVDVVDFGGPSGSGGTIVIWPPDGATGVADQFLGNELPAPPAPPSGSFPSGPIASMIFERNATVVITSHQLMDSSGTSLPHTFIAPDDATLGPYLSNSCALYGDGPAAGGSSFHVIVSGTVNGTAFTKDWTFTVQ
jgi:hypothetical protein